MSHPNDIIGVSTKSKGGQKMINVLKKMITSKDYEVVSLGEQVLCNKAL